uniref:Serine hydrolase FSH domain-containing protein n=1 Tax=Meloidogyne floridensis TaxID=298350 RepID=A0A915NGN0_9BILA
MKGPFDGFLGFSQGASFIYLLLASNPSLNIRFVILFSGFKSLSSFHNQFNCVKICVKSLHIWGLNDEIVLPKRSEELAEELFKNAQICTHPGKHFFTNIASKSIPSEFSKATKIIANLTGKKEASVMVLVNAGNVGCFGGSNDPFIYAELQSVGGFTDPNKVTGEMTKLFTEHFGVPGSRVYMKLTGPDANQIACDGKLKG